MLNQLTPDTAVAVQAIPEPGLLPLRTAVIQLAGLQAQTMHLLS